MRRLACALLPVALLACGDDDGGGAPDAGGSIDAIGAPDGPAPPDAPPVVPDAAAPDAYDLGDCGNGTLDPPEQCDDGANLPNDGCTPWCQVEADCNGNSSTVVTPGVTLTGDTTPLANVAKSPTCGGGSAGEQIFQVTVYEPTRLTVTTDLPGTTFDTAVYVRRSCGTQSSELACAGTPGTGDTLEVNLEPGTYFVFVDGRNGAEGVFELALSATPLATIHSGGACQPDQSTGVCEAGTLCVAPEMGTHACTPVAMACDVVTRTVTPGTPVTGTTAGAPDLAASTCSPDGDAGDAHWRVDVPAGQRVDLLASAAPTMFGTDGFDPVLSLATTCAGGGAATLDCSDSQGAQTTEKVEQLDVAAGSYTVIVDGYQGKTGAYALDVRLRPIRVAGEDCDPTGQASRCDTGLACTGMPAKCQ